MKKRIGNLRGKPIIEGDKNLMTPNELHIDSLGKSDNEGGGSDIEYEYYCFEGAMEEVAISIPSLCTYLYGVEALGVQEDQSVLCSVPNLMEKIYYLKVPKVPFTFIDVYAGPKIVNIVNGGMEEYLYSITLTSEDAAKAVWDIIKLCKCDEELYNQARELTLDEYK